MKRLLLIACVALLTSVCVTAQSTITGTVHDQTGEPVIGAMLRVAKTNNQVVTGVDGQFAIVVDDKHLSREFVVRSAGYPTLRVSITDYNNGGVIKLPLPELLDEEIWIPPDSELETVTVTATRAQSRTPVTYVELDREEIQERNLGQDAPYLLKWTPSVVVSSDAGTGTGYTGIWIRGSDPTRTNVTINGIPYNDSESQGVFWVNLPDFSSSADNIQIQRGVGTSTNGAGAFGATIDFNTNQIDEAAKLSIDGSVGSFGTRRGAVNYTSGLLDNGLKVDARFSQTNSDGYVDRASADLTGYYAGLTYVGGAAGAKGGQGAVWRFNAFGGHEVTYQSWNGVTEAEIEEFGRTYNSVGTEKEGEPYDNEVDNYRQNHYQLHYNNTFGGQWNLALSGHYTRGLGYFEQYKADEELNEYGINPGDNGPSTSDLIRRRWLDNHFYGTVYSLRYRHGSTFDLTFGGSANEYLGDHYGEVIWARNAGDSEIRDRYYDNDATKRDFSNYLRGNLYLGSNFNAYLDLQLRNVSYQFLGFANDLSRIDEDVTHTFFNPKAGLLYELPAGGQAYASFGVAQREPNRNDYTENPAATRPRPEQLFNTEVGIRKQGDRFNYGANFYHMYYNDQLVLTGQLNDVGEYIRANVPSSTRLGLELQGGYAVSDRFTVGGNLTLSRNRIRRFREFLDSYDENFDWLGQDEVVQNDVPLAFSPSVTGALDLNYKVIDTRKSLFEAGLQTKYVGERFVDNSGSEASALDAYHYADLRVAYTLRPRGDSPLGAVRFTLLVRNVTNQLYFSNGWSYRYNFAGEETTLQGLYPQAGRNVLLGVGVDF